MVLYGRPYNVSNPTPLINIYIKKISNTIRGSSVNSFPPEETN